MTHRVTVTFTDSKGNTHTEDGSNYRTTATLDEVLDFFDTIILKTDSGRTVEIQRDDG